MAKDDVGTHKDIATFFGGKPAPPPPAKVSPVKKAAAETKDAHPDLVVVPKLKQSAKSSSPTTTKSRHFPAKSEPTVSMASALKHYDAIILDSSDEEPVVAKKQSIALKKKPAPVDADSDEEMANAATTSKGMSTATKRKKSNDSDHSSDGAPAKTGRIPVGKVGTKATPTATKAKATKKKPADEDSTDDDDEPVAKKGKGKIPAQKVGTAAAAKKPPAKKAKTTDATGGDGEEKPKWVFKPKMGPAAPGSKEVPSGEENCLAGLTFVFSGELSSLSREEGQELVKRYGGRVTGAPSGKTSYVVLGQDAGPKKLETIARLKIKTLNEDTFLELIGQRPAGAVDAKFLEKQAKEEQAIITAAKAMPLAKDSPDHLTQLWTVKYAPSSLKDICGNKGMIEKMSKWLEAWPKSLKSGFKHPGPDAMGSYRAILISGAPGIGKTTAAHLVANLLNYDILELNASDTRSKKLLETAFKSKVDNTSLSGFFKTGETDGKADPSISRRSVIIMDEVDGMSAGDRGGVGALNALIKKSKIPIIAICNDKSSPKMKPFMGTCFNMVFKRPSAPEVRSRMLSIAFKEGLKLDGKVVDQLVAGSQSDIRQVITMLSTLKLATPDAKTKVEYDDGIKLAKASEKNSIQTPWTLHGKLTSPQAFSAVSNLTLNDKLDCYFADHSFMPLFVQENYLKASYSKSSNLGGRDKELRNLELVSMAAEAMSDGDLVDRVIHGEQHWSLMPVHGMFSCVRPASYTYGAGGFPNFPAWLGKNSTQTKNARLLGEVQIRMRLKVSGDRKEIRQHYIPTLFSRLVLPLVNEGAAAIPGVIEMMDQYYLTKEDWDAILELGCGPEFDAEKILKSIPPAVKSAFTRTFNKADHPMPFAPKDGKVPKQLPSGGGPKPDNEDVLLEDDVEVSEPEEVDDDATGFAKSKMVKEKKPKAPPKPRVKKEKA